MIKIKVAIIVVTIFIFCACEERGFISTPIGDILKKPRNYEGKIVKVKGDITSSVNLIIVKYFALRDKTGEIYVVTNRILPKQGDAISVKGRVQEGFTIGPSQFIVIMEDGGESRVKE